MAKRIPTEVFSPGEIIKDELDARGWTHADLAHKMGCQASVVSEIITGKRDITLDISQGLSAAFGTGAQLWMNLDVHNDTGP